MGKLKETLLNNLTPDEMNERMLGELSAFEYVEYMENYKHLFDDSGNPIPEDVLEQINQERAQLEAEFYEQERIDEINEFNKLKYTDNDILYVLDGMVDPQKMDIIMDKFRDIWATKIGI